MRRYVLRGFEDRIIGTLEEQGIACFNGLPGIGKTTTARYIALKMQRDRKERENKEVPIFILGPEETREIEFHDENGERHTIQAISFGGFWKGEWKSNEIEFLARQVVKIANRSFFDKVGLEKLRRAFRKLKGEKIEALHKVEMDIGRVAALLAEILSGIFGDNLSEMFVTTAKDFLKNHWDKISDASHLLLGFGAYALPGLGMGLAGFTASRTLMKMLKNEKVELKGEVIFVVDDLADLSPKELNNAIEFVRWLRAFGAKVLLVKRFDDFDEYLKISEKFWEGKPFDFNDVFGGARKLIKWREQFWLMEAAEREEFKDMLAANGYEKEKIKEILKTEREDVEDLLYFASAGSISVTLMVLDAGLSIDEIPKPEGRYFPTEEIEKKKGREEKKKMIQSNRAVTIAGIKAIYEKMRKENFGLITLFVQNVAEDELEKFCGDKSVVRYCKSKGYSLFWNLEDYKWMLEFYEESFAGRERRVYSLNERWKKMRSFVKALKDEKVESDMKLTREILLKIMTADNEKVGEFTVRMLLSAFESIEWLKDKAVLKLKEALFWGTHALEIMPFLGFKFGGVVEEMWQKEKHDDEILLYASTYAYTLVEFGKCMMGLGQAYMKLVKLVEMFIKEETKDDAVLCHRATTYSSSASGLIQYGLIAGDYLGKAERIIESIGELKEVARVDFWFSKGQVEMRTAGGNPFESLKRSSECLERIEMTEVMRRFLKPYGGKAEKKFKEQLNNWRRAIYYELGIAYMNADEIEEAKNWFRKSLDYSELVREKLLVKSFLSTMEVIENYEFKRTVGGEVISFEEIWEESKSNWWKLTAEGVACGCANHLVSEMVNGEFKRDDFEWARWFPPAFSLLNGIGCIFGFIDKHNALEELKNLDLIAFAVEDRNPEEDVIMEEISNHVEELYNSALDAARRREYELRKVVEISVVQIWQITFHSQQALARIMMFYIVGDLECAQKLAEQESSASTKLPKLPNRLFKEFADAIRGERERGEEAREEVRKAFVKLFYLHV